MGPSKSSVDNSFNDFAGIYEAHEENSADPSFTRNGHERSVERGDPEAKDGNNNLGHFATAEVLKEATSRFDADWGDFESVTHSNGSSHTKGDNGAVAEFGAFTPQCAPVTVGDFGDLDSFRFALGTKEETLE